jgi:5-methyltetrahydrofolate--homocysteine methyltransferase
MHAVFLKHAVEAGLSMAIVNPGALVPYEAVEENLRSAVEDLLLCRRKDAADRLVAMAAAALNGAVRKGDSAGDNGSGVKKDAASWRSLNTEERVVHALVQGLDDHIEGDVLELRPRYGRALDLVEGPLMRGIQEVSRLFGEGKLFLPQVIRSARVMKKAVGALEPFIKQEKHTDAAETGETILLATVKGDVHDIGKNIVGVVLGCNGYRVKDLGIMAGAETILDAAEKEGARMIGLSGLITPSLQEMIHTAREMEKRRLTIPLIIGGATTSLAHTALRIAPEYSGPVVYVSDAGESAAVVRSLLSSGERPRFLERLEERYREAAAQHAEIAAGIELASLEDARKNRAPGSSGPIFPPRTRGLIEVNGYSLERILPYIDGEGFLRIWNVANGDGALAEMSAEKEAAREKLLEDARKLLDRVCAEKLLELRGVLGIFPACSEGDDVLVYGPSTARFAFLRNQRKKRWGSANPCLADFLPAEREADGGARGWLGLFALSAGFGLDRAAAAFRARNDDYGALLLGTLADSLAEAFAEEIHLRIRREWWGYAAQESLPIEDILAGKYTGIRPAFGYPACPDHQDKRIALDLLEARQRCGFTLTESAMIVPAASVCGMVFSGASAYHFGAAPVGEDQLRDWAERKGIGLEEARIRLGRV